MVDGITTLLLQLKRKYFKIACINTNRRFIGIELEEKYFEIAKNRILK